MNPEDLVSDDTTTPDEAIAKLEPLPEEVHGTMHVSSETDVGPISGLPVTKEPSGPAPGYTTVSSGVAPALQNEAIPENEWDWSQLARPPFIVSFVDQDNPNGGFVIGWDTCGACSLHIRTCTCKDGPSQPSYVKRWRSKDDTKHDKPATREARKAVVVADPQTVEKAVEETLDTPAPKVRKQRSDIGQPRGPRKKVAATADSVLEAASDLSAAMSKET